MSAQNSLTVGTRGSKLALIQSQLVVDALKKINPELVITTKIITTKGDINQAPIPVDTVGKSWFTKEIEDALIAREIDFAVHSLKDVPPELPDGLMCESVLERADPRDVLISKSGKKLVELPEHAIIGTDSVRRKALLLTLRPDLNVQSIRGNVDTRLQKLANENYDSIVLAAAGLERLGLSDRVTEFFNADSFVPAIGQGILAVEVRRDYPEIINLIKNIQHEPTLTAANAEQTFSKIIGGGCKLPIGCYASIEGDIIAITGTIGDGGSAPIQKKTVHGNVRDAISLAENLAKDFLKNGDIN